MECGRVSLFLSFVFTIAIHAESRSVKISSSSFARHKISPSLDPASSKKFFGKDYPNDQRPGVDVLHFKHPYPVVQDSSDFDSDFVKDENSDDGNFKAQQEYDRLRHKLAKEKMEADKALEKKRKQEQELKRAVKKYGQEVSENRKREQAEAAKKQLEAAQNKDTDKHDVKEERIKSEGWSWSWSWPSWKWPSWTWSESEPAPKAEISETEAATKETEQAMDNLEKCREELAEAREALKKLMDAADTAKVKQAEANSVMEESTKKQLDAQKLANSLHDKSTSEKAEYTTAKSAHEKQKALVEQLKVDLDAAAAKVKAYRDAEDKDGAVYNAHVPKGFATPLASPKALLLLFVVATSWQFF